MGVGWAVGGTLPSMHGQTESPATPKPDPGWTQHGRPAMPAGGQRLHKRRRAWGPPIAASCCDALACWRRAFNCQVMRMTAPQGASNRTAPHLACKAVHQAVHGGGGALEALLNARMWAGTVQGRCGVRVSKQQGAAGQHVCGAGMAQVRGWAGAGRGGGGAARREVRVQQGAET